MDNFTFWTGWKKEYQYLFFLSIALLFFSNVFLGITAFSGLDFLQGWGTIQDLTTIPIDFQKFTDHYHEFNIEIINYLIYEKYTATLVNLNPNLALIYVSIIFTAFTLFLTFSTTLSKYLYFLSILMVMLFLAMLNLDLLEIFEGDNKNILTVCLILYGGTSYAIYSYFYNLNLTTRFLIFAGLNTSLLLFIYSASPIPPYAINYHISGYLGSFLIVLTAVYIVYIAIENSLFIVFLNSNNKRGSLATYMFINILYLVILILNIFQHIKIYGVNEFSLLIIGSILTIWGTLKRNGDNKSGDTVARVLLITVIGSLAISTIAFHTANQNSSLITAFRKEIFICFLAYGGGFFLYTMVNFIGDIKVKSNVYKFIFKPNDFTAFRMYMLGLIASYALFAYKYQKIPYYQAISGYYNGVADSYYIKNDLTLAEPFYNYAKDNDAFNNKSNVALANLAIKKGDLSKATELYKYATVSRGNEQAYLQLSNIYSQKDNYFDALFTLKKGLKRFPKSSKLWNNLGILSKKSSLNDSTVYYFSKATEFAEKDDYTPLNNLITFLIKKDFDKEAKELIESIDDEHQNLKTKSAIAAYNAKNGVFNLWEKKDFGIDSTLQNEELAYLFNHFLNNISLMDSTDLNNLEATSRANGNIFIQEPLTQLKAFYEFYNGSPRVAHEHMATLSSGNSFYSGYFNNLAGQWMMMHQNYKLANKYFSVADEYNFQGGKFSHAFTETILESGESDSIWLQLGPGGQKYYKSINSASSSEEMSDFQKLFILSLGNQNQFEGFVSNCKDSNIIDLMKVERINFLIENNNNEEASTIYNELAKSENQLIQNSIGLIKAELELNSGANQKALETIIL